MKAQYRCWKCKLSWTSVPGPVIHGRTKEEDVPNLCPQCGSDRFDWLNWEEIVKAAKEKYEKGR